MGGRKTSLLLTGLEPDTPYTASVVAVFPTATSGEVTAAGRTSESTPPPPLLCLLCRLLLTSSCAPHPPPEPLGGVRNLQVLNPTMTTLNVRWEPAEGRVKEYRLLYGPAAGTDRNTVGHAHFPSWWVGDVNPLGGATVSKDFNTLRKVTFDSTNMLIHIYHLTSYPLGGAASIVQR